MDPNAYGAAPPTMTLTTYPGEHLPAVQYTMSHTCAEGYSGNTIPHVVHHVEAVEAVEKQTPQTDNAVDDATTKEKKAADGVWGDPNDTTWKRRCWADSKEEDEEDDDDDD